MPFDAFSLKLLQISLGWFSKKRLDIFVVSNLQLELELDIRNNQGRGHVLSSEQKAEADNT